MAFGVANFRKNASYLTGKTNNIRARLTAYSNAEVSAISDD